MPVNARAARSCLVLVLLTCPPLAALAQNAAAPPAGARPGAPAAAAAPAVVATVGTRRITREEYERRLAVAQKQAAARGTDAPAEFKDVLRREMLETLIRMNLLVLEAPRQNIGVSTPEAESLLKTDPFFSPDGKFDAKRWQLTRTTQPDRFQGALQVSRDQVAARKLDARLQAQFTPDEAEVRTKALRQLRRVVTEDLSLNRAEFNGNYAEPREGDVLRFAREHA